MRNGLIYVGDNVYQRTTVLLDLEVLGYLQKAATNNGLTLSNMLNKLLLRSFTEEKESERV